MQWGIPDRLLLPFYDSLLVKITTSGPNLSQALDRMHRALREMRIRGVKTNIPFLENVISHKEFVEGRASTKMIDVTPELFRFKARRDRASRLLNYLGEIVVNGNPQVKGRERIKHPFPLSCLSTTLSSLPPAEPAIYCLLKEPLNFPNGYGTTNR